MRPRPTTALLIVILAALTVPARSATRIVNVGPNQSLTFVDMQSNTSTTTIFVGDTVQWIWQGNHHSTTSGSCATGTCQPDAIWDSGIHDAPNTFSFTFTQAGSFPYFCRVHGTTFLMRGKVVVASPADFKLQILNPNLTAFPNQSASFQGNLTSLNGYSNAVTVSCGVPHPANCGMATVTPTPGGTVFSIAASDSNVTTFNFALNAVGSDANKTSHAQAVLLTVSDFGVAASGTVTAPPTGTSSTLPFTVQSLNGFSGTVTLACAVAPTNTSCNFSPSANVAVSGSDVPVSLTVTTAGAAIADSTVSITANSAGGTQKSANFTLSVVDIGLTTPSPSTLTTDPTTISPSAGFSVTAAGSFAGAVTLSCLGLPAGASCNFSPSTPVHPTPASPVPVSVQIVTAGVAAGTLNLQIAADSPGLNEKTQNLTVQVQDYAEAFANPIVAVFPGGIAQFNGTLTALNGYSQSVALSCISAPAACGFSPGANVVPTGAGAGFSASIATTGATVPQDYPFQLQGLGSDPGATMHAQSLTMRVIDFTLGALTGLASGNNLNVTQGNPSSPLSFTITPKGQFVGTITLSCSGLPTGASCDFSPGSVIAPKAGQTINVSVVVTTGIAAAGTSSVTISATATGTTTAKTQPAFTLNIAAGGVTTNLNIMQAVTKPGPNSPAGVGTNVILTSTVSNLSGASPVQATLIVIFTQPVSVVNAGGASGASCSQSGVVTDTVTCTFPSANGSPLAVPITVQAPFARSFGATAFVSSADTDSDPSDNAFGNVVEIRLRPLSRNGLPIANP